MAPDQGERDAIIRKYLGKSVRVVIDRPVGYQHGDIVYPIPYGYLPGVQAGDGEEQDAYILGCSDPGLEFEGRVIGVIRRMNDCEDKLVVAPEGKLFHQGQIMEAVSFQEQYFISTVESLLRRSCGVIPFRRKGKQMEYLILLQTNQCWSFPKGHMEPGESEEGTALRELFEETGLTARLIPGKRVVSEYEMAPNVRKQVVLYVGEVDGMLKLQDKEILDCKWVSACELQTYLHPDTFAVCKELFI